ncbi:MAG: peptidoglycan DD-metalloendopeptidase family protein [Acetobacterium sp.]|uniref:peptidoglycan DD-metalloendopeptidase family protein n=1 Tax=Acetobacterium sp. TaxID=1872094 RepID=UPI003242CF1C
MADGKIIIETEVDTSGVEKSTKNLKSQAASLAAEYRKAGMDQSQAMSKAWAEVRKSSSQGSKQLIDDLDRVGKSSEGAGSRLSELGQTAMSGLKAVGGAIAAAFAVDKIIEFGKAAIEAAGSAKAMEAQFTQVFGDLEPMAQDAIDKMADKFGMVSNRLKPSMSQMTSMFKGLGLDTEAAMQKASDAVTLSADAAAFYDIAYSDANSALTSFIKGNYEGGEAIGIFANDTQMAQFAIQKGLVETTAEWSNLDEATKQATRLEYAQNMQNLAGATGQAARESDGLENQLGNINQAWTDFLAIVGGPVLGLAVEALKGLTSGLQLAGDGFKTLLENAKKLDLSGVAKELSPFGTAFERVKIAAIDAFDEARKKVFEIMPQIIEAVQPILAAFQNLWENVKPVFLYLVQVLYESVIPALSALFAAFMETLPGIINFLTPIYEVISNLISFIWNIIGMIVAIFQGDWSTAWEFAGTAVKNVVDTIGSILNFLWSLITGILSNISNSISASWKSITDTTKNVWDGIINLLQNACLAIYDNTIGKMIELVEAVTEHWDEINTATKTKWSEVKQAIIDIIFSLPAKLYEAATSMISEIVRGIKETASNVYDAVTGLVNDILTKFKEGLGIASPSKELFEIGKWMIKGLINGLNGDSLIAFVNKMIEEIKTAFAAGNFNLKAAIDFIGSGALEFFKSIGIGGASMGDLTAPVSGSVTSGFGYRDDVGDIGTKDHMGIDIGVPEGTPVGAAGSGTVVQAGWNGGYGYSVMIDHGNGLESLYGHLSEVLVSVGDLVTKLQTIGLSGNTGNSTGPHLHFGLMQDGVWIDPSALFGLATGTNRVPKTGPYLLHKDEAVVPKKYNPALTGNDSLIEKLLAAVTAENIRFGDSMVFKSSVNPIRQAISQTSYESKLDSINETLDALLNKDSTLVLDTGALVGGTIAQFDSKFGTIRARKDRGQL